MKNTQKGFIVPLLIAIIAILVIGGGAYFYTQNKNIEVDEDTSTKINTSTETNTLSDSETNSWKTYENKNLNFEIKYPPNYQIDTVNSTNSKIRFYDTSYIPRPESDDYSSSVTVEYVSSNNTNDWRAILEKQFPGGSEFKMNTFVENPPELKTPGITNSVRYDISQAFLGVDGYAFRKNGYNFFIYEVPKDSEGRAVFQQMVNTLRFK